MLSFRLESIASFRAVRRVEGPLHVRLAAAEPHLADEMSFSSIFSPLGDGQSVRTARGEGIELHAPPAVPRVRRRLLSGEAHRHLLVESGGAPDRQYDAALEDRVVAEEAVGFAAPGEAPPEMRRAGGGRRGKGRSILHLFSPSSWDSVSRS